MKPDKTATFSITAEKNDYAPSPIDDLHPRVQHDGGGCRAGTLLSGTFVDAHGVRCYERKGAITGGSGTVSTFTQVLSADGIVYSLMATCKGGGRLRAAGKSARPSTASTSSSSWRHLSMVENRRLTRRGYAIGQNALIIVLVSAVMIVIMLVAFIKHSSERKSRRGRYRVRASSIS